jgi:hypothetical protein
MAALLVLLVLSPVLLAGCDSPPQILDISPGRGARDVHTNQPIRIHFDRPLDRASVAARFSVKPKATGTVTWEAPNTLVYQHETFDPNTQYLVSLAAGYRDAAGNVNTFNHSWSFQTEVAPELRSTTPAQGEAQVDPAVYLNLGFSREMDAQSFRGAVTFSPAVPYAVRSDPSDAKRILIAPKSLLSPSTDYQVSINANATDADGNHLAPTKLAFHTGQVRSLTRWITFVATETGADAGSGVWMVDEAGFPRLLEEATVDSFSWSSDGSNLLVRHPDRSWTDYPLGATSVGLPFKADWAAYLGPDSGYAYLDGSVLSRWLPSGSSGLIATGVGSAAVSPGLNRIAFTQPGAGSTDIRIYDVSLRAQFRVQREADEVSGLAFAPNGARLAYVLANGPGGLAQLRVKSFSGAAAATTVATGEITDPAWLAGSSDLVFSARVEVPGGRQWRVFRINPALPPSRLTATAAIGPSADGDAFLPHPSPDGHQIAFLFGAVESAQVWLMNSDGTRLSRLTGFDSEAFPYSCRALHWAAP